MHKLLLDNGYVWILLSGYWMLLYIYLLCRLPKHSADGVKYSKIKNTANSLQQASSAVSCHSSAFCRLTSVQKRSKLTVQNRHVRFSVCQGEHSRISLFTANEIQLMLFYVPKTNWEKNTIAAFSAISTYFNALTAKKLVFLFSTKVCGSKRNQCAKLRRTGLCIPEYEIYLKKSCDQCRV